MAEYCGDKGLLRAAHGQTWDKPCKGIGGLDIYCNDADVDSWRARVDELLVMMTVTWNSLYDAEGDLPTRIHTAKGSALRARWSSIENRIKSTPDLSMMDLLGIDIGEAAKIVAELVSIAEDQACLIETMRKYIRDANGKPPPLPHFKPEKTLDIGDIFRKGSEAAIQQTGKITTGLLLIAGVAVVAYVLRPVIMAKATGTRASSLPKSISKKSSAKTK